MGKQETARSGLHGIVSCSMQCAMPGPVAVLTPGPLRHCLCGMGCLLPGGGNQPYGKRYYVATLAPFNSIFLISAEDVDFLLSTTVSPAVNFVSPTIHIPCGSVFWERKTLSMLWLFVGFYLGIGQPNL